jgi:hypothetical protein
MEEYASIQHESKKETKDFVTRLSHKIQKTVGLISNKQDILLDSQISSQINMNTESCFPATSNELVNDFAPQITKLIRSEKRLDLFEDDDIFSKKDKYKGTDSDMDLDTGLHFRDIHEERLIGRCGSPCPFSNTFIYLDRDTEQLLAKDSAIQWTSNPIKLGDIGNIANTSEIFIWKPGLYLVYYNVCSQQACKFLLFKNGDIVSGSTINYIAGFNQNSVLLSMSVNNSDFTFPTSVSPTGFAAKIEVVNHTPTTPVKLMNLNTTDNSPQMVATIRISLLSEIGYL